MSFNSLTASASTVRSVEISSISSSAALTNSFAATAFL